MKHKIRILFRIVMVSLLVLTLTACQDSTAPTISKDGELSYTIGDEMIRIDELFSATDEVDGDVTSSISVDDSNVDYTTVGTYQVVVTVEDTAGNATESIFDLTVLNETEPPIITGFTDVSIEQGNDSYDYLDGVTAEDNLDGDLTSSITVDDSTVDYDLAGVYETYYSVSDAAGNETIESVDVTVTYETVDPTIEGLEDITIGLDEQLPNFMDGVTAEDNFDGDITNNVVVSYNPIDTAVLGTHIITYSVTDAAGNEFSDEISLDVVDMTAPVIDGTRDLTFKVFSDPDFLWKEITVTDNIDGDLLSEVVIDDSLVDMNTLGTYNLTYSVSDAAGNVTSTTVAINVKDFQTPNFLTNETIYYVEGDSNPNYLDYIQVEDNYDGDLTSSVVFDDSTVDLNTIGTYNIVMTAEDSSGNTTTETLLLVVPSMTSVNNVLNDIDEVVFTTSPIENNLSLSTLGSHGSTITWDSLNDLRMTDNGKILPPGIGEPNAPVTLVATYSFDTYQKVVEYELLVAPKSEAIITNQQTYDYIALGEEFVTTDGTLNAYYEENGNIPYVDMKSLLAVSKGAIEYDLLEFSYVDPILTISYDYEYEDDDGVLQTETLVAYFNFDENTVTSPSSDFFSYYTASTSSDFGEGLIYLGSENVEPNEITLDLGYYGFDMVVYDDNGTNKYLVPFNIIELVLFGDTYYDVYFNHETFYGTEHWQLSNVDDSNTEIIRTSSFNDSTMPKDMKMAAYNYMAFVMDYYYGIKSFSDIDTYYNELEPYIEDIIFSNDIDFYRALYEFIYGLDDLHSSHTFTGYYQPEYENIELQFGDLGDRVAGYYQSYWGVQDRYDAKYGTTVPSPYLLDDGKTAIIHISGFTIDTPDEFKLALEELPTGIENVIIDVANNGGGNSGAAWRVFGYLTEETYSIHFQNPLDGSAVTYNYESEYVAYDYNWFVLTSPVTFSAANMFASMAQELGIPVIGQNPSGGASSIQVIQPFGGSVLIISSNSVISSRVYIEELEEYEYLSLEYGFDVDYKVTDFLNDDKLIDAINDILNNETE